MPSLPSPRRTLLPLAATVAVAAAGCVKQEPPGLKVTALEATIVFGIKPSTPAAPPPGVAPPLEPVSAPPPAPTPSAPRAFPTEELPPLEAPPLPPITPRPPTPKPKVLCPTAPAGEFPVAATNDVAEPPKAGAYLWRPGPPVLREAGQFPVQEKDLFARVVFDVSQPTTTTLPGRAPMLSFTYKVATYRGAEVVVDSFRVVNNGISDSAGAVNAGPQVYFGQPDRGVSLTSRVVGRSGRVVARFNPSTPVLLLPLPIESGSTFQSAAVDPASGATQLLYGQVLKRQVVDACGKEVDGWAVNAQTAFRDPSQEAGGGSPASQPRTSTFSYVVATGEGGLLITEKVAPLSLPQFPLNGTPLDGATPKNPDVPATPANAAASEISLASAAPTPLDAKGLPKDELVPGLGTGD